jgi:signal transduction histidine kinase
LKDKVRKGTREFLHLIDFGSLKIQLWFYFGLFAVILIGALWILQIVFLNYSYEDMKIMETRGIASQIENRVHENELSQETRDFINRICKENELYIQIETVSGTRRFIPNIDANTSPAQTDASGNQIEKLPSFEPPRSYYPTIYRKEIDNLRAELLAGGQSPYSKQTLEPNTERKTLEYAAFLDTPSSAGEGSGINPGIPEILPDLVPDPPIVFSDDASQGQEENEGIEDDAQETLTSPRGGTSLPGSYYEINAAPGEIMPLYAGGDSNRMILFIFSPLYPMGSTVGILSSQLAYVTIIALLLAMLIAFYLSRMITKPIIQITERAEELAKGNFGIDFPSSHYSEIKRLGKTLTYTSSALADTRTLQRDIIANVSHDLKTPLTMIRSYAEMIHDFSGDDPEKREAHLQVIINETERLNTLISELLDISQLQSGETQINPTDFSMRKLIESTVASYAGFAEQNGYRFGFSGTGEGVIRADETRIAQVLNNLISNAMKYGGKAKTVEILMREEADCVRCEVTDYGIGISKRDLKHIWERYYRTSTHHSRTDSTGLGLSIVKEILVLHRARFGVTSVFRKGTTFWFEIRTKEGESPTTAANGNPVVAADEEAQ